MKIQPIEKFVIYVLVISATLLAMPQLLKEVEDTVKVVVTSLIIFFECVILWNIFRDKVNL